MSDWSRLTSFSEINAVLNDFRVNLSTLLGSHFQGMYVVGSLALGDFDLNYSDIDFVVVTDTDIGDDIFHRLQQFHSLYAASNSPWATKIEAVYTPKNVLRTGAPTSKQYPQIEKGTGLFKAGLESGWVFQCYTLREHGLIVAGPDPHTLIDPINPSDMRSAVAVISGLWVEQARHDPTWQDWVRQRDAQVFVILTLCRMLYSLTTSAVVSKRAAAQWTQSELEPPWTTLIASSLARQYVTEEIPQPEVDDTVAFIQ